MDLPDLATAYIRTVYQYIIQSGDFIIEIDVPDYQPDSSNDGLYFDFRVDDVTPGTGSSNRARVRYNIDGGTHEVLFLYKVNGISGNSGDDNPASRPTKLRITRSGNILSGYYYTDTWHLLESKDFSSYASDLYYVKLNVGDQASRGGYVEFDNLIFVEGCPAGYPKAWTTTTSSTTTTTV